MDKTSWAYSIHVLGDQEVTANLYCHFAYPYWEGCVICSIYLRQLLGHPVYIARVLDGKISQRRGTFKRNFGDNSKQKILPKKLSYLIWFTYFRDLCTKHNVLWIADEVLYRTVPLNKIKKPWINRWAGLVIRFFFSVGRIRSERKEIIHRHRISFYPTKAA